MWEPWVGRVLLVLAGGVFLAFNGPIARLIAQVHSEMSGGADFYLRRGWIGFGRVMSVIFGLVLLFAGLS